MFHVGQMVVCVHDDFEGPHPSEPTLTYPIKGFVYTIRGINPYEDGPALLLEEVVNPPHDYVAGFGECDFCCTCFRPVRKTDISVFREVVESVRNRTLVPADIGGR